MPKRLKLEEPSVIFCECVENFLENQRAQGVTEKTLQSYSYAFKAIYRWIPPKTDLQLMSAKEINKRWRSRRGSYQIKVWGSDIGTLNQKAEAINEALQPTGWKRISTQEMYDRESAMIQKIMLFSLVTRTVLSVCRRGPNKKGESEAFGRKQFGEHYC